MYDKWLKVIPSFEEFIPVKTTMTRRRQHVLNYWKYPYTNAFTESINNQIKAIEKAGRGYKFNNLRRRCLLEINTPLPKRFNPADAVYVTADGRLAPDRRKDKIRKLYAPDAKPEPASGTANPAGTMGYFVPFSMRKKYEPYSGELIDYLQIYLECNSHPEESFSRRIQKYYQELKVKNL